MLTAPLMVRVGVMLALTPLLSVTLIVTVPLKAAPGVPLMIPLDEPIASGAGKPVAVHVYGDAPPVTLIVWLHATPAVPAGRVAGEITRAALIVRVGVMVALAPFPS